MTAISTTVPASVADRAARGSARASRASATCPTMTASSAAAGTPRSADREVDDAASTGRRARCPSRSATTIRPCDSPMKSRFAVQMCGWRSDASISRPRSRRTPRGRGRRARAAPARRPRSAPRPSRGRSPGRQIASATLSDCSTMIIVCPRALQLVDELEHPLHDDRREPERQLVDEQDLGLVHEHAGEREHLLLAAREAARRLLAAAPRARGRARARRRSRSSISAVDPPSSRALTARFCVDGEAREHALAAGQLHDADAARAAPGATYVMLRPLSRTTPRSGTSSPLMTRRIVDLPAPFVPSSATHSPRCDLEVDVEQHLHRSVGEVDVGDLEHRRARAFARRACGARPAPRAAPRRRARGRCG